MQNTFQETVETPSVLHDKKRYPKVSFIKTKSRKESVRPVKMLAVAAVLLSVSISLSWMSNGLFLKELVVSGAIILMVIAIRAFDQPHREINSRYHQNNLN